MDLLELLQAGDVEGFNVARERASKVELFAEELAGLKLHGVDLTGAVLDKSDLTGTDLTDATLVRASLQEIDGTGLVLDGAIAMGVRLRDAFLEAADLSGADLSRGDLSGAVLTETKGEGLRLIGAKLKDAKADGAVWPLADLTEALLKGADLSRADLTKSKLTAAKASHCVLEGAKLDGSDAVGVSFGGANLRGASLRGAKLTDASFAGADLTGADLSHADLTRANFAGANLTGADVTGASLADACLDDATLTDATFSEADLTGLDARGLGLAEDAIEGLASHGARFDPDAPLVFDDAVVATVAGAVTVAWLNPDDPEHATLRWIQDGADGQRRSGVLPVSGSAVMAHTVLPAGEGFALVAIVDRPGGASILRWPLSATGELSAPRASPLGYEPAVLPVFREAEGALWIWCLSRRGPTLVVHRDVGRGFDVVHTEAMSQASGFFGFAWPVLASKGGVVTAVGPDGAGPPRRMPEGFPTRIATAVPVGDRVLAVWNTLPRLRDPGGLRVQWLGGRRAEDTDVLTRVPDVHALDGVPHGDGALLAWTEDEGPEATHVMVAHLPDGRPDEVPFPEEPADGIRIVPAYAGSGPWLAVTTLTGRLHVLDLGGRILATFGAAG